MFLKEIFVAFALVMLTVAIHALGFAVVLRRMLRSQAVSVKNFLPIARMLVGLAWSLILIHVLEIALWAVFYWRSGCLPNAETAFYFSGVTYTTVGYGDVVLTGPWRMLAPVEALTGILMCGLSTGLFFARIHRLLYSWANGQGLLSDAPTKDS